MPPRDVPTALAAGSFPKVTWSAAGRRSEEHTSELQSHLNLVCRLLLEKKHVDPRPPPTRSGRCPGCLITASLPCPPGPVRLPGRAPTRSRSADSTAHAAQLHSPPSAV